MTNFSKSLIRCSALGLIMNNPKGKTNLEKYNDKLEELRQEQDKYDAMPKKELKTAINKAEKIERLKKELEELEQVKDVIELSETCKSYLIQNYVLEKYGRIKDVTTKEMKKGVIVEDDSIQLFSIVDGNYYQKNEERISNDFIIGTPDLYDGEDIYSSNEIIDIKSSWDIFTFLANVKEPMNDMYYWQLMGYMALTGAKIGTIAYCLTNTPDAIVEEEKYYLLKKLDVATEESPKYKKELKKLLRNRYFDDIPLEERVLTTSIERNEDDIEKIYKKVVKCREFLAEFEQEHLSFSKHYRKKAK